MAENRFQRLGQRATQIEDKLDVSIKRSDTHRKKGKRGREIFYADVTAMKTLKKEVKHATLAINGKLVASGQDQQIVEADILDEVLEHARKSIAKVVQKIEQQYGLVDEE